MEYLSNGKIRRSESEWRELYNKYLSSGLSASKFCKQEQIANSSFSKWIRKFGGIDNPSLVKSEFVELEPVAQPPLETKSSMIEFELGNGQILRVRL